MHIKPTRTLNEEGTMFSRTICERDKVTPATVTSSYYCCGTCCRLLGSWRKLVNFGSAGIKTKNKISCCSRRHSQIWWRCATQRSDSDKHKHANDILALFPKNTHNYKMTSSTVIVDVDTPKYFSKNNKKKIKIYKLRQKGRRIS